MRDVKDTFCILTWKESLSKMCAPLHGVSNLVAKDMETTEVHSVPPLLQVLTGDICAQIFGQGLGSEVLPTSKEA